MGFDGTPPNPLLDQPLDQTDLGSSCLQYRLPKDMSRKEEQTDTVLTGGKRVNTKKMCGN